MFPGAHFPPPYHPEGPEKPQMPERPSRYPEQRYKDNYKDNYVSCPFVSLRYPKLTLSPFLEKQPRSAKIVSVSGCHIGDFMI